MIHRVLTRVLLKPQWQAATVATEVAETKSIPCIHKIMRTYFSRPQWLNINWIHIKIEVAGKN